MIKIRKKIIAFILVTLIPIASMSKDKSGVENSSKDNPPPYPFFIWIDTKHTDSDLSATIKECKFDEKITDCKLLCNKEKKMCALLGGTPNVQNVESKNWSVKIDFGKSIGEYEFKHETKDSTPIFSAKQTNNTIPFSISFKKNVVKTKDSCSTPNCVYFDLKSDSSGSDEW